MGKKLKGIFSKEKPTDVSTIEFHDQDEERRFHEDVIKSLRDGESFTLKTTVPILKGLQLNDYFYPDKKEQFSSISVKPKREKKKIYVKLDGIEKVINYSLTATILGTVIEASFESMIDIRIQLKIDESSIKRGMAQCNYKWSYSNKHAPNVATAILAFKEVEQFIKMLFFIEDQEKFQPVIDMCKKFDFSIAILTRYSQVISTMNLKDHVSSLKISDHEHVKGVEYLYRLFVEKKPIKIYQTIDKLHGTKRLDERSINTLEGMDAFIRGIQKKCFNFLGDPITFYICYQQFNARIQKIKNDPEKNESIIYVSDTDVRPMFASYKAYLTKEEADAESNNLQANRDEYYKALTLEEYTTQSIEKYK